MTKYVVLEQMVFDYGETTVSAWVTRIDVDARNDVAAIREVAGEKAGTYLAIPVRSFTPRVVRVETHTRIRLDSAATETP